MTHSFNRRSHVGSHRASNDEENPVGIFGWQVGPHRRRTRDQACICAWFPTEVAKVAVADLNDARDTAAENTAESEEAISVEVDVSDMSSTWNMAAITLTS